MATEYDPGSNYRNTPIVDNKYLDIYVSPIVGDINDYDLQDIVVENKYNQRPDLLAYHLYGNAKLWWVFAEYNPDILVDPIIDFVGGMKIKAPVRFG